MSHSDIIIISVTLFISSTLGVYSAIRVIKQHTRPPVNTLIRRGDIELNYIEPIQPGHSYQPIDLVNLNYEPYNWGSRIPSYYTGQHAPSYFSTGNPPSYHSGNGFYINSCLENTVNVDYILWLIFFLGFIFIVKYLTSIKKHDKIVFSEGISTNEITFTKDYQKLLSERLGNHPNYFIVYGKTYYHILNSYWTLFDIIDWLKFIEIQDYAVTFELISNTSNDLSSIYPKIILTNEFIVNMQSNPVIISSLLSNQLENVYNMFDSEYNENHYILIRYTVLTASQ
jgi:hypothetical protein